MGKTILQLIEELLGKGAAEQPGIAARLEALKEAAPDTAAQVDGILAELGKAVTPENLASLGPEFIHEALDISRGKFKPEKGASDLI